MTPEELQAKKGNEAAAETARRSQTEQSLEARHREKMASIGDVTQEERKLILREETLAGKIAAAETILKQREEKREAEQNMEVLAFTEAIREPIHSEMLTEAEPLDWEAVSEQNAELE